jgi:hypothetical protein
MDNSQVEFDAGIHRLNYFTRQRYQKSRTLTARYFLGCPHYGSSRKLFSWLTGSTLDIPIFICRTKVATLRSAPEVPAEDHHSGTVQTL